MVDIPIPTTETLAVAVLFYVAGLVTPWYYAQERIRGFGRALASRIPYRPPPGKHKDDAMQEAVAMGKSSTEAAEEAEDE